MDASKEWAGVDAEYHLIRPSGGDGGLEPVRGRVGDDELCWCAVGSLSADGVVSDGDLSGIDGSGVQVEVRPSPWPMAAPSDGVEAVRAAVADASESVGSRYGLGVFDCRSYPCGAHLHLDSWPTAAEWLALEHEVLRPLRAVSRERTLSAYGADRARRASAASSGVEWRAVPGVAAVHPELWRAVLEAVRRCVEGAGDIVRRIPGEAIERVDVGGPVVTSEGVELVRAVARWGRPGGVWSLNARRAWLGDGPWYWGARVSSSTLSLEAVADLLEPGGPEVTRQLEALAGGSIPDYDVPSAVRLVSAGVGVLGAACGLRADEGRRGEAWWHAVAARVGLVASGASDAAAVYSGGGDAGRGAAVLGAMSGADYAAVGDVLGPWGAAVAAGSTALGGAWDAVLKLGRAALERPEAVVEALQGWGKAQSWCSCCGGDAVARVLGIQAEGVA